MAARYPAEALHVCDFCFGPLEVAYDYEAIAAAVSPERIAGRPRSIWRYRDLLPVADDAPVDLGAGSRPLVRADRLAAELGLGELWIKDDTANPTGSFKDRVVSVALTKARQLGFKVAACASTGNLANSVAAHAARAGLASVVLIPADLEAAKITMTAVYGATVVAVEGTYDDVNRLCAELDERAPLVGVRECERPHLLRRGLEDPRLRGGRAARWRMPDHVVVPIASGSQLTKVAKGFAELAKVGLVDERPRRCGSRAPRRRGVPPSPPRSGRGRPPCAPVRPNTIAKSLAIGNPADGWYTLGGHQRVGRGLRGGERRRDHRRDPPPRAHRGHLRRDRRRGDDRPAGQVGKEGVVRRTRRSWPS